MRVLQSKYTGIAADRRSLLRGAAGVSSLALFAGGLMISHRPTWAAIGPVELGFVGWQGYDGAPAETFPTFTAWMEAEQIEVASTYVNTNEEMLTKIQASPEGTYDLTCPFHGTVPTMIAAGVLEPLDTSKLANYDKVHSFFREQHFTRGPDGAVYAIPFTYSHSSPLYNADKVKPLESFAEVVEDPAKRGRYTLIDSPNHFTWIAQILGFGNPDPNHITRDELAKCQEYARLVIAGARSVAPALGDIQQLLVAGEVDYSLTGTYNQVAEAQAAGVNIQTFFAKEGAQTWVDCYCVPKASQKYDAALAWIDQSLAPGPQAEVAEVYGGAVVNVEAVPLLKEGTKARYDYDNLDSVLARAPVIPPVPAESDEFATYADWTQAWSAAK